MITCYHGLIGSSRNWAPLSRILGATDRVLFKDIDYIKQTVTSLISEEQRNLTQSSSRTTISVGNSLGCVIALGIADKVDKMILTAPPYTKKSNFIPRGRDGVEKYIRGLYCDRPLNISEQEEMSKIGKQFSKIISDRKNIPALRALRQSLWDFDYWKMVKLHGKKIHIVLGEEDHLTPVDEISNYIASNIPEVKMDILPGCGHAVPLEKPERLAEIIERYK